MMDFIKEYDCSIYLFDSHARNDLHVNVALRAETGTAMVTGNAI